MLQKTLYVLILSGPIVDTLHLYYSEGELEAEEQAKDLEAEHGGKIESLRSFPRGFKLAAFEVPGTITVPDELARSWVLLLFTVLR
jgi:hypothetical protein